MPGLLTLRPLASAAKAGRTAAAKSAVNAARAEKPRDDRAQGQGKTAAPAFVRSRLSRVPSLHRMIPPLQPAHVPACNPQLRPKQVSDPLAEAVRANLRGNGFDGERVGSNCSSGSEHEPNSVCLAEMVNDFMEDEVVIGKCGRARCNCESFACEADVSFAGDNDDSKSSLGCEASDIMQGLVSSVSSFERSTHCFITSVLKALKEDEPVSADGQQETILRRSVMSSLRAAGHNAALCKSRWDHAGGFPGGDHEYIDLVWEGYVGKSERLIIDIDFKSQFEIARPTSAYNALLQSLPVIYVGKSDRLQQIVSVTCDAAKRSMKKRGMHLPPWRKPEYIKAKWFSPYRRTTNEIPLNFGKSQEPRDIGSTALRGADWDSRFINEMEEHYNNKTRKILQRDLNAEVGRGLGKFNEEKEGHDVGGVQRGGNRIRHGPEMTVVGTDWEPPSVKPRNRQGLRMVPGLATCLVEAGLTGLNVKDMQDSQKNYFDLSSKHTLLAV